MFALLTLQGFSRSFFMHKLGPVSDDKNKLLSHVRRLKRSLENSWEKVKGESMKSSYEKETAERKNLKNVRETPPSST